MLRSGLLLLNSQSNLTDVRLSGSGISALADVLRRHPGVWTMLATCPSTSSMMASRLRPWRSLPQSARADADRERRLQALRDNRLADRLRGRLPCVMSSRPCSALPWSRRTASCSITRRPTSNGCGTCSGTATTGMPIPSDRQGPTGSHYISCPSHAPPRLCVDHSNGAGQDYDAGTTPTCG